ncbi:MAG: thiamine pyrophosphate-binding protein [Lachnospiraceae bacterium]
MKASDVIVSFLHEQNITDVFGYPGGMVTHLMESLDRQADVIRTHVCYHEQAAAFAACGYAQAKQHPAVAFATSGPGATNLMTGICHAYFDSVPVLIITGQVNTYESRGSLKVRQKGFQETDIVAMAADVTKYAVCVRSATELYYHLTRAFYEAVSGRPGPVLLDIPMDVQRALLEQEDLVAYEPPKRMHKAADTERMAERISEILRQAERPCILLGAGCKISGMQEAVRELIAQSRIPAVTSMNAVDLLSGEPGAYGFIGAYGHRAANFVMAKCDCLLTLGSRLDVRQTGANLQAFAPHARLLRVDIDADEMSHQVKEGEETFCISLQELVPVLLRKVTEYPGHMPWRTVCEAIKTRLEPVTEREAHAQWPAAYLEAIGAALPPDWIVTTDVGQNQVWVAQFFQAKVRSILFSGGHGAMGYSLPAAIGAWYATGRPVLCFTGDGGLQMNIQELAFLTREDIPVKILVLNNHSLGMIRHFQEMYFGGNAAMTTADRGYMAPDFVEIAQAYGVHSRRIETPQQAVQLAEELRQPHPALYDIQVGDVTYVYPKLAMGKPAQDQDPLLERGLYEVLMNL